MVTKSLTQNRPHRTHEEIAADIGTPGIPDLHPLIGCAPHVMGGHAYLKSKRVTVERIVRAVMNERAEGPLMLADGVVLTNEEVRAALAFDADVQGHLSRLHAQLAHLRDALPKRAPSHRGGKYS